MIEMLLELCTNITSRQWGGGDLGDALQPGDFRLILRGSEVGDPPPLRRSCGAAHTIATSCRMRGGRPPRGRSTSGTLPIPPAPAPRRADPG